MNAEEILIGLKGYDQRYTLDDARLMKAYCEDRALTPFYEVYPVLTEYNGKNGHVRNVSFKEHYSVLQRWAQQSGGYSTPLRETNQDATGTDNYGKTVNGVNVRIGVLTNRDFSALVQLANAIPGFNYTEERKAFLHIGEAFVPNSHKPPSGKTIEWVARKRAEEEALRRAFGREPQNAREMYSQALTASARREATNALYGTSTPPEALPAPEPFVDAQYTEVAPQAANDDQDWFTEEQPTQRISLSDARKQFGMVFAELKDLGAECPVMHEDWSVDQLIEAIGFQERAMHAIETGRSEPSKAFAWLETQFAKL